MKKTSVNIIRKPSPIEEIQVEVRNGVHGGAGDRTMYVEVQDTNVLDPYLHIDIHNDSDRVDGAESISIPLDQARTLVGALDALLTQHGA